MNVLKRELDAIEKDKATFIQEFSAVCVLVVQFVCLLVYPFFLLFLGLLTIFVISSGGLF